MTLPSKDNLCHLGLAWPLVNEIENQIPGLSGTNTWSGTQDFSGCTSITDPSNVQTLFGGASKGASGGTFNEEGNIFRFVSAGTNPASTAADIVITAFTLPANAFDISGRGLAFTFQGNFAANANNKTCKIIVGATTAVVGSAVTGGTTIGTTGVSAGNNVGWQIISQLFKYGVAGSNTQAAQQNATVLGSTHSGIGLQQNLTLAENATILCAFTCNAATTATDISAGFAEINAMN